jgi:hypothetical protein
VHLASLTLAARPACRCPSCPCRSLSRAVGAPCTARWRVHTSYALVQLSALCEPQSNSSMCSSAPTLATARDAAAPGAAAAAPPSRFRFFQRRRSMACSDSIRPLTSTKSPRPRPAACHSWIIVSKRSLAPSVGLSRASSCFRFCTKTSQARGTGHLRPGQVACVTPSPTGMREVRIAACCLSGSNESDGPSVTAIRRSGGMFAGSRSACMGSLLAGALTGDHW